MGGSDKGGVSSSTAEKSQSSLAGSLSSLMTQQSGESSQLYNLAYPALEQSEQYYSALASGSPNLMATAVAPAAQQVQKATAGSKKNIMETSPSGGERNLALENADVKQGEQIGQLLTSGYTGAQDSLAKLGSSGIQLSQNAASTAISAGSASGNQWSNIVNENTAEKGASLGAFGSLIGAAGTIGGAYAGK